MDIALTTPASQPPAQEAGRAALDDPDEWQGFSRALPGQDGQWESYIAVGGMHCAACTLSVERALAGVVGVHQVQVNGPSATARLVWSPAQGGPSRWLAALDKAGYQGVPAGDMLAAGERRREQRLMLWRWLVAGFCMMQVMMYAVPAYTAEPGEITPDIESLLRWASWVLTLPVLLFSCRPFFASALRDVRNGRVGMDVPVTLGILIAFAASTAATFDPQGPLAGQVAFDSVTMFVFFLLSGRLLELRLRGRTAGSLEALTRRLPQTVLRCDADGNFIRVAVRKLRAGDQVRILPGEVFPADGRVLAGQGSVDEALLTGESRPLARGPGDAVIAGSHNLAGVLLVEVERTAELTRYAQIVALMERAAMDKPRLAQLADRIASPFLLVVLAASAASAAWWWPQGAAQAIAVAVSVLIVTCPCALSLATPAATLAAAGALARRGILVRRMQALESAAQVDTVVFDKTGTLTMDRMAVNSISTRAGLDAKVALRMAASLAQGSLHPVSRAIVAAAAAAPGQGVAAATGLREVAGKGVEGQWPPQDGAAARNMKLGSAAFCDVAPGDGGTPAVHLADEDGWLASFELGETPRTDAVAACEGLLQMGLQLQVLSGDRGEAVRRLGARLGLSACAGDRTPEDKLAHVRALQSQGRHVAMIGDGMNDGPVLAAADISVAIGDSVPLAQARSDFIVPGGQLAAVPHILSLARRTRSVVRQNLAWAAGYNAVCVPLAVMGMMPTWLAGLGMAASSLLVVMNSARLARADKEH